MRVPSIFVPIALVSLGAAGCYNPGDLGLMPFECSDRIADCPDNYVCDGSSEAPGPPLTPQPDKRHWCIPDPSLSTSALSVAIPKSAQFDGARSPLPFTAATCPEKTASDDLAHALPMFSAASQSHAICPAGRLALFHAADGATAPRYVRVAIAYQVATGDLDLAFVDAQGKLAEYDGSAHDGGCVVTSAPVSGDVWLAVTGANNVDQGLYTLQMDASESPLVCPAPTSGQ